MRRGGHDAADGVAFVEGRDAVGGVDTVRADEHEIGADALKRAFSDGAVHRVRFMAHGATAHDQRDIFVF